MDNRLNDLATRPVGRLLWHYSLPAVVGMLVMSLYNVIDRIFIGQGVGPEAISGLAITFPVMNLSTAIGVLVGAGTASRMSIALGRGDLQGARVVLGNSLTLTLLNACIYIAVFALTLDPLLRLFGASDATLPYAHDFMLWLLPGLLLTNVAYGLNNAMRASGYPRKAMIQMLLSAAVNLVLAPLFIFGFGLGIKGAALATDLAMLVSAIYVVAHFCRKDVTVSFTRGTFALRWDVVCSIISIGASPALVNAAACFINVILNTSLVHHGGDMAVGAAGIFTTYASLLTTFVVGLSLGAQPIIGYNYGAGRIDRLRSCYLMAAAVATAVCTAGCIIGLCFPGAIARLFTTDPTLIDMTSHALSTAMLAFFVVGFQIVSTNLFQSIGKAALSIVLSLSRQVLFMIPLLLWFARSLGLEGIWLAFPASDILATGVTAALVIRQFRQFRRLSDPYLSSLPTLPTEADCLD